MSMLNLTSIPKSVSGQAQLLEIASTMADLERPFNAADSEAVDKFVLCANAASEFFSVRIPCHGIMYIFDNEEALHNFDYTSVILKSIKPAICLTA